MDAETNANREYKDSVFTLLFSEKEKLIELYNAIFDAHYDLNTEIEITTLRNVLFMGRINDISFVIDGKIVVLIEHQSTINDNMPLRMLLYIAKIYEKISSNDTVYRTKQITIPRPEFVVLYNGKDEAPDVRTLKLSDMFAKYGESNPIELELEVKVYNINKGRNPEIARRSETLDGYERFSSKVREYEKETNDLKEVISLAINYCIERNILETFLKNHGSEVINMLLTEWKFEDALRVREQESRREGIREGVRKGRRERDIQIGKMMCGDGVDVDTISKYTGLTVDDVLKYCK
jgi:predicted transposase/invertase (TIGR01784 family)